MVGPGTKINRWLSPGRWKSEGSMRRSVPGGRIRWLIPLVADDCARPANITDVVESAKRQSSRSYRKFPLLFVGPFFVASLPPNNFQRVVANAEDRTNGASRPCQATAYRFGSVLFGLRDDSSAEGVAHRLLRSR